MKFKITIAGLLHDIGKFYQRADTYENGWKLLKEEYKNLTEEYCPNYKGKYSHKHVLWTAQFVEDTLKINETSESKNSLLQLATRHHKPNTFYEQLITLGDHLSSGMDRNKLTEDVIKENTDFGNYKSTPLLSVFETINSDMLAKANWKFRLPVNILDTVNIFPVEKNKIENLEYLYAKTWDAFENEIKDFINLGYAIDNKYTNSLFYILKKYLTNIPSSTMDLPDVSLFDHSKTTAAFATCLYDYSKEYTIENIGKLKDDKCKPFILYGADVSGIQKYIFNIVSKNAAKNLKGRSFYLHLITNTIVHHILDQLNLTFCQVVYNSGGSFYLILPNTDTTIKKLEKLNLDLEKELFEKFGEQLYVASGYCEFGCNEVFNKQIDKIWVNTLGQIQSNKNCRYKNLMISNFNNFFEPFGVGDLTQKDSVTGEELLSNYKTISNDKINFSTWKLIELGKALKKANYWTIINEEYVGSDFSINFLGYSHILSSTADVKNLDYKNPFVYKINNINNIVGNSKKAVYGFEFYGGNDFPAENDGSPKTFDHLVNGAYNKIGVVRMDVDNLGYIFANGFSQELKTFSRYASLSRNLDLFFKGYINELWSENKSFKNHTTIIFSGGDDLIIMGDWEICLDFAEVIRNKFKNFTCNNPIFSLSGGVEIVTPKFPILKASINAEKAELKAKSYVNPFIKIEKRKVGKTSDEYEFYEECKTKDAFCFLGSALGWELEYSNVKKLSNQLFMNIYNNNEKSFSKALLQLFIKYNEMAQIKNNEITNSRAIWMMNYDFSRRKSEVKSKFIRDELEMMRRDVIENKWLGDKHNFTLHSLTMYAIASRWTELKLRNIR